jgi:hypothetical protein
MVSTAWENPLKKKSKLVIGVTKEKWVCLTNNIPLHDSGAHYSHYFSHFFTFFNNNLHQNIYFFFFYFLYHINNFFIIIQIKKLL